MKWILSLAVVMFFAVSAHAQTRYVSFNEDTAKQQAANDKTGDAAADDILNMDIDQLARTPVVVPSMDIPVTSVTKDESTVGRSAAAVFVITPEMIRRSGATCIPEALRMAPGMDVAQINSNTWAISCRGFNSSYSNKLLVLIDGRTVYNPDFSGVFWNQQDVLLEDVERIEVVRGPGGTLWGANAVNGVISIITKNSKDTQGAYAMAGGGTYQKMLDGARYGGRIGEDFHYRIYGKHFERGRYYDPNGLVDDAWWQGRFGFRADWEPGCDKTDTFTIQGDHYVGETGNSIIPTAPNIPERQTGENLLMRWRHVRNEDSDWTLQAYYDRFTRGNALQTETVKTLDIEFQYRFPLNDRNQITCGAGFRNVVSFFSGGDRFTNYFPTPYWTTNYINQFIQDEISIVDDRLKFIIGCKLEQNPYTGLEYQPTARLLWTPDRRHTGWAAISRAVRTPSRAQEQITLTFPPVAPEVYPRGYGNSSARSEDVMAYEIGYRTQATDQFSWDITAYYNAYDNLGCSEMGMPFVELMPPPPHLVIPQILHNEPRGETYGAELSGNYSVSERWRLYAQYTAFQMHMFPNAQQTMEQGNDPCNQVYLRSAWDIRENVEFDLMARYVDSLTGLNVPSYITMDIRLAWRPRKHLEMAVVGQNLLQNHHWEFAGNTAESPTYATEVVRGVYGTFTLRR